MRVYLKTQVLRPEETGKGKKSGTGEEGEGG